MDITSITSAIAGAKTASEIIKNILPMVKNTKPEEDFIDLKNIILTLQSELSSTYANQVELLNIKDDLEKQLTKFQTWHKEKRKYKLEELQPGIFVYSPKPKAKSTEPIHWLCTNCYEDGSKSILQTTDYNSVGRSYVCHRCNLKIFVSYTIKK